jgi:hypothetical protein
MGRRNPDCAGAGLGSLARRQELVDQFTRQVLKTFTVTFLAVGAADGPPDGGGTAIDYRRY